MFLCKGAGQKRQSRTESGLVMTECRVDVVQQHGQLDTNSGSMISSRDEHIDQ